MTFTPKGLACQVIGSADPLNRHRGVPGPNADLSEVELWSEEARFSLVYSMRAVQKSIRAWV